MADYTDIAAFHAHELNPTTDEDRRFDRYCADIAKELGLTNIDGDSVEDGYSIDDAFDFFDAGLTVAEAVAEFRHEMNRIWAG